MNPHKAQLKLLIANELGADIEDAAEAYEKDQYRFEGGAQATKQVYKAIQVLMEHVNKDLDEGKFSDFPEPIEVAKLVKSWLMRAMEASTGVGTQMEASKLHAQGKVAGVRAVMDVVKKQRDAEQRKLEALLAAAEEIKEEGTEDDPQRRHIDSDPAAELASRKRPRKPVKKTATKAARKVRKRAGGAKDS